MRHAGRVPVGSREARQTVFLDRDGVINRLLKGDYVKSWDEFEFIPGALDALRLLAEASYRVIVVTNQRGVARGVVTATALEGIHERMAEQICRAGGRVDAIYYCPHEIGACGCRKPDIGLFVEAQSDFGDIDFAASLLVGDSESDMAAGTRLGCQNLFVGDSQEFPSAATLYEVVARYCV